MQLCEQGIRPGLGVLDDHRQLLDALCRELRQFDHGDAGAILLRVVKESAGQPGGIPGVAGVLPGRMIGRFCQASDGLADGCRVGRSREEVITLGCQRNTQRRIQGARQLKPARKAGRWLAFKPPPQGFGITHDCRSSE